MNEKLIRFQLENINLERKALRLIGSQETFDIEENPRYLQLNHDIHGFLDKAIALCKINLTYDEYEWVIHTVLRWETYLQIHFMDYSEWDLPDRPELELKSIVLSNEQIGRIEAELKNLDKVFIVCDKVDYPTNGLRKAVEKRFSEGIVYTFLISKSKAEEEIMGYYKSFEALACIAIKKNNLNCESRDLVKIKRLDFDWDENPCIFYFQKLNEKFEVLAFQGIGSIKKMGISDMYNPIPDNLARLCIEAIRSKAPEELVAAPDKIEINTIFDEADKIISMDTINSLRAIK